MRIVCPRCGATLCEYGGGSFIIRHRGRLIVTTAVGLQLLQCWRCHAAFDGKRVTELLENNRDENGTAGAKERSTS